MTQFSVEINTIHVNFSNAVHEVPIRCSDQRKKSGHVCLPDFCKIFLTREKYPLLRSHTFFTSLHFGSAYICEKLFPRMKHRKSYIRSKVSDKELENSLRIATTSLNQTDALASQKQDQISPYL